MTPGFLGIDVGGTASRWALVGPDGAEIARGSAGGATGHLFSDAPRRQFGTVIAEIAAACADRQIRAAEAGVTGLGGDSVAVARRVIAEALGLALEHVGARDDIEMAYSLVFRPGEGHLVSAGTGSIGVHMTVSGEMVRVGGRGILIDDAGSGSWIALRALDLVYRDIDVHGRPRETAGLAEEIFAMIGDTGWDAVRSYVYGNHRGRIGELARAVGRAAQAGNAVASDILSTAGTELARLATALEARCGPRPIAVVGRVPALSPLIADSLRGALPGRQIRFETTDQALGAAHLARSAARHDEGA